jgi:cysteinyl-tRNA synthetase
MSKSKGGFLTLQTLIDAGFDPLDYRYFLLGGHYRSQLQFSYSALEGAKNARRSLREKICLLASQAGSPPSAGKAGKSPPGSKAREYLGNFMRALEDDLSTPRALAELWGLLKDAAVKPLEALVAVFSMDSVLGLGLGEETLSREGNGGGNDPALVAEIEKLIGERQEAKGAKNYGRADEIRQALKDRGIILEDTPGGTSWRKA